MSETPSPTRQLAAIELVWDLAREAQLNTRPLGAACHELRAAAEALRERDHALGETFANLVVGGEDAGFVGWAIGLAVASQGGRIAWPNPEPSGEQDQPAAGDTAPETAPAEPPPGDPPPAGREPGWYRAMRLPWATYHYGFPATVAHGRSWTASDGSVWTCDQTSTGGWWRLDRYAPDEQDTAWGLWHDPARSAPVAGPTRRERILAEVAAIDLSRTPSRASLREIVTNAARLANAALPGVGMYERDDIVRAAAMLVLALERMDADR